MSARDWNRDRQARQRRDATSQARYDRVRASERSIDRAEQNRYARFVLDHRTQNPFCRRVAEQVARGKRVTAKQAATLQRIAHENGWKVS